MPRARGGYSVTSARMLETFKQYTPEQYEHHLNATFTPTGSHHPRMVERIALHRARLGLTEQSEFDLLDN